MSSWFNITSVWYLGFDWKGFWFICSKFEGWWLFVNKNGPSQDSTLRPRFSPTGESSSSVVGNLSKRWWGFRGWMAEWEIKIIFLRETKYLTVYILFKETEHLTLHIYSHSFSFISSIWSEFHKVYVFVFICICVSICVCVYIYVKQNLNFWSMIIGLCIHMCIYKFLCIWIENILICVCVYIYEMKFCNNACVEKKFGEIEYY